MSGSGDTPERWRRRHVYRWQGRLTSEVPIEKALASVARRFR
jgi:hypothetical protein